MLSLTEQPGLQHDRITGLPRLGTALADIHALARRPDPERLIGVVSFAIRASPALYRLTPEAIQHLRNDISRQLAAMLQSRDKVYSIGEWEWLAVLPELVSSAALTLASLKLCRAFTRLFPTFDGNSLALRAVCGAAFWPDDGDSALHLVQSARIACLQADHHDSGAELYAPDMEDVADSQHRLHHELQDALQGGGGLALHLQPQVDLRSGRCVGAEALLRWQRPNGEWVPPNHTLAVVSQFGLIKAFNRWLFQQGVQSLVALTNAGIDLVLSLNLSANDLLDPELPDLVAQALATWGIASERLLLEITETVMVEETEQVTEVLQRLRSIGIKLSIDDFGTGYAGMSYLQRLPVQEVKVDQSFVRHVVGSPVNLEIVASIVQLAHRLGMLVVAEGMETEEIRHTIRDLGCDRGQGHLFSRALPLADFIAWWQKRYGG